MGIWNPGLWFYTSVQTFCYWNKEVKLNWANARACVLLYTLLFDTVNNPFEKVREVKVSNNFLRVIYQTMEFRISNKLVAEVSLD